TRRTRSVAEGPAGRTSGAAGRSLPLPWASPDAAACASAGAPGAGTARTGRGADHLHAADGAVTEFLVQPPDEGGREQAQLGRPRRRVRGDGQLAVLEAFGPGVLGELRTDDPGPVAEHAADGRPLLPPPGRQQLPDCRAERLGVAAPPGLPRPHDAPAALAAAAPPGHRPPLQRVRLG